MQTDPVVEAVERGGGFHQLPGVKVVSLGEGTASVELPAGERTTNPFGTQSGGALYGVAGRAPARLLASGGMRTVTPSPARRSIWTWCQ